MSPSTLLFTSHATALLAALSGSLHCLGMCGPLRLLAQDKENSRIKYQVGRLFAYLMLGSLAGAAGYSLPLVAWVPLLVIGLLLSMVNNNILPVWKAARQRLVNAAGANPFFLGLSSGLLPCGLLHAWVALAAATRQPLAGATMLAMLWVGTLPALEAGTLILRKPLLRWRAQFPRALPFAFLLIALVPIALRAQGQLFPPPPGATQESCHGHSGGEGGEHHHVQTP